MKKLSAEKKNSLIKGLICLIVLLAADQITKYLAYHYLRTGGPLRLIPGVFELHYLQNQGAAFGMLENMQWIFILFALVIVAAAGYLYVRIPLSRKFYLLRIICVVLAAGALGNMIDRLVHHYVIDFLYFSLIEFPIFNVADVYVCVSTAALLFLILFYYKEEDFDQLMGKKTREDFVSDIIDKIQESKKS